MVGGLQCLVEALLRPVGGVCNLDVYCLVFEHPPQWLASFGRVYGTERFVSICEDLDRFSEDVKVQCAMDPCGKGNVVRRAFGRQLVQEPEAVLVGGHGAVRILPGRASAELCDHLSPVLAKIALQRFGKLARLNAESQAVSFGP